MFISTKHTKRLAFLLLCCFLCSLQGKAAAYAAVKIGDYATIEDAFTPPEDETIVYYLNNSSEAYTLVANKIQELWVGEHHRFNVAANKREKVKISWSSSNPEVAKIVKTTGELTALSAGQTVIRMKDSANGVVKKFTLTVKPVPVLPEIPEEWYFVEDCDDFDFCAEWKRVYPEGMSEEACYRWESIPGVKLVFREEYRDLYGQCSLLRLPEEINGKRVLALWLENFDKGQWPTMYAWGFLNLRILQGPMYAVWWTYDINVRDPEAGVREMIYPSDAIALTTAASSRAERLHIPESVVVLADGAWWGSKIYQIRIPAGVKAVGVGERDGGEYGRGLAEGYFCVDGNNTNYYSIFGVLFSYPIHAKWRNQYAESWLYLRGCDMEIGRNILIRYPRENTSSAYRVPDGVEKIAEDAFWGSKFLKKIILPDSVTELGVNAFAMIQNDVEIVVPASVTVFEESGGDTPFGWYPIEEDDPYVSVERNSLTIVTPKGSAAEAYAIEHGIKYRNE